MTRRFPPDELRRQCSTIYGASLREGDVWAGETASGRWIVKWYPHRHDHPDWPSLTVDSDSEAIPTERGSDSVLDWARWYFPPRDPREFAEALLDADATAVEAAATERAFEDSGFPVIVNPAIELRSRYPELIPWLERVIEARREGWELPRTDVLPLVARESVTRRLLVLPRHPHGESPQEAGSGR